MNDIFFYLSKKLWLLFSPGNLFVVILTLSWLLLLFKKVRMASQILGFLVIITLTLTVIPVADWLLHPLETRFQNNPVLPDKVDGIIVLGGSILSQSSVEWQQLETNDFHERLSSGIQLANKYPQAKFVFSGGNANTEQGLPTEAQIAKDYFLQAGISPDRLYIEDKARNTEENVIYSKQLVNPQPQQNWVLVTTAFHMPRAMGLFCKHNWRVIAYPVDHHTLPSKLYKPGFNLLGHANQLYLASHEWLGLLAYYATGKTDSLFPGKCHGDYSN